jgi:hypothetical protein
MSGWRDKWKTLVSASRPGRRIKWCLSELNVDTAFIRVIGASSANVSAQTLRDRERERERERERGGEVERIALTVRFALATYMMFRKKKQLRIRILCEGEGVGEGEGSRTRGRDDVTRVKYKNHQKHYCLRWSFHDHECIS